MSNELKRIFNIDSKYYFRSFDYQKLVSKKMDEISSPHTLNLYLIQCATENVKLLNIPHSNLKQCKSNIEAIFQIMTSQMTNNMNDNSNSLLYTFNQDGITHHKDVFTDNNILNECFNKISTNSLKATNSNLTQILSRLLLSLDSRYQEFYERFKVEEKKKINLRLFISLSNLEIFKDEDISAILNNMNSLFNVVINPVIISNDIISAKFCRIVDDLGFIDCKNSSYKLDSSVEYLDWLMKPNKNNIMISDLYSELIKIKTSCDNTKFVKSINDKFNGLIRIFETINRFQKLEKSKITHEVEVSKQQLNASNELYKEEKKHILDYIKTESSFFKSIENHHLELDIVKKNIDNISVTVSKSGCKNFYFYFKSIAHIIIISLKI